MDQLFDLQRIEGKGGERFRLLMVPVLLPFVQWMPQAQGAAGAHVPAARFEGDSTEHDLLQDEIVEAHAARVAWFNKLLVKATPKNGVVALELEADDLHRLLQCINDLRLVCWRHLGCPDPLPRPRKINLAYNEFPDNPAVVVSMLDLLGQWQEFLCCKMMGDA